MREERFVGSYLKEGDTLVDVGANIGTIALTGAARVGSGGRVLAIEPHPRIFECLKENGALNGCTTIQYYNCAIGASSGVVTFSDRGDDDQNKVMEGDGLQVEMRMLDDLLQEAGVTSIDLLKIDVEGFEKYVLDGASKTLKATACVYIETLERNLVAYKTTISEIHHVLQTYGFQLFHVNGKTEEAVAIRDPEDLKTRVGAIDLVPLSG